MNDGLPFWAYLLSPFVIIPALILAIVQLPTIIFAAVTFRWAATFENAFWGITYATFLALLCIASFAWPLALAYGLSQM